MKGPLCHAVRVTAPPKGEPRRCCVAQQLIICRCAWLANIHPVALMARQKKKDFSLDILEQV